MLGAPLSFWVRTITDHHFLWQWFYLPAVGPRFSGCPDTFGSITVCGAHLSAAGCVALPIFVPGFRSFPPHQVRVADPHRRTGRLLAQQHDPETPATICFGSAGDRKKMMIPPLSINNYYHITKRIDISLVNPYDWLKCTDPITQLGVQIFRSQDQAEAASAIERKESQELHSH
jgi:hypothetical protein